MNRLSNEDRQRVVACLCEGNSIRSTVRITGIAKKTVQRLGVELGEACEAFADRTMHGLTCQRIIDNGADGVVVCPDGKRYEVKQSNRRAVLIP